MIFFKTALILGCLIPSKLFDVSLTKYRSLYLNGNKLGKALRLK